MESRFLNIIIGPGRRLNWSCTIKARSTKPNIKIAYIIQQIWAEEMILKKWNENHCLPNFQNRQSEKKSDLY